MTSESFKPMTESSEDSSATFYSNAEFGYSPVGSIDVCCDQGPRKYNEDRYIVCSDLHAASSQTRSTMVPACLVGVCDGHGGDELSQYCQENFVPTIVSDPDWEKSPDESLKSAMIKMEDDFVKEACADKVGTTFVAAIITEAAVHCTWIGDSEAWLFRRSKAAGVPLVSAHRPLRPDERRRIEGLGGCVTRTKNSKTGEFIGRVNGILAVSRSLGDCRLKKWVPTEPESQVVALDGREEFLVLGSDGLWDALTPKEVGAIIRKELKKKSGRSEKGLSELVAQKARAAGIDDNVTVLVVLFNDWDVSPASNASLSTDSGQSDSSSLADSEDGDGNDTVPRGPAKVKEFFRKALKL